MADKSKMQFPVTKTETSDEPVSEKLLDKLLDIGKNYLNTGMSEKAVDTFKDALEKAIKFYKSETSFELAKFYYAYGTALLGKIEEIQAAPALIGKEASKEKVIEKAEELSKQNVEEAKLAWENLEVARTIAEKQLAEVAKNEKASDEEKKTILRRLSKVLLRLGDLLSWRQMYKDALKEYQGCLDIRLKTEDLSFSRDLAEINFLMGNTHLYLNEPESEDKALHYLDEAKTILENILRQKLGKNEYKTKNLFGVQTNFSRDIIKESPLDSAEIKDLKQTLNQLYDKIEDSLYQQHLKLKNSTINPLLQPNYDPTKILQKYFS